MDKERWKLYVEGLKKRGADSIKALEKQKEQPVKEAKKDTRPPKELRITHHMFVRFTELFPAYTGHLPSGGPQYPLNIESAKMVRNMLKSFFKIFTKARRIVLPFKTVKGKFFKHGATECHYFKSTDGIIFTVVREKGKDTMVTCGRPTRERQKEHAPDPMAPADPSGRHYMSDITEVSLPYKLRQWVDYDPSFALVPGLIHPVRFQKEGELEDIIIEEESS